MSTVVLRNVPEQLHARLKKQAERNHRSLNKEAVALIEQALAVPRQLPKLAAPVKLKGGPLSIAGIEGAIAKGRD
jgi:plasmid stability protein